MTGNKMAKRRKAMDNQPLEGRFFSGKDAAVNRKEDSAFFVQKAAAEEDEMQTKLQRQSEEEEMQTKLQRAEEEEEVAAKLQRQNEEEEMQTKIQRKDEQDVAPAFEADLQTAKNGGHPLPEDIRLEMENFFGSSLKHVRIHDDEEAAKLCNQINAQAFTHGSHIFFNKGKYQPYSSAGKELLTHELTHVIQQG